MELLNDYKTLCEQAGLRDMHAGAPRLERQETVSNPDQIWELFAAEHPRQGWLQCQSRQMHFTAGLPEPDTAWGLLLAAEAVNEQGDTLMLRQNGRGGWVLSRYRHDEAGDGLWDTVTHCLHGVDGQLCYRRYWKRDATRGVVQHLACLTEIKLENNATGEEQQ